jgi:hypothetical protein
MKEVVAGWAHWIQNDFWKKRRSPKWVTNLIKVMP